MYKKPNSEKYFMVTIQENREIDSEKLANLIGFKDIKEEEPKSVKKLIDCDSMHLPPFGSVWKMNTYADINIRGLKVVSFRLGQMGHDVTISYNDFYKSE